MKVSQQSQRRHKKDNCSSGRDFRANKMSPITLLNSVLIGQIRTKHSWRFSKGFSFDFHPSFEHFWQLFSESIILLGLSKSLVNLTIKREIYGGHWAAHTPGNLKLVSFKVGSHTSESGFTCLNLIHSKDSLAIINYFKCIEKEARDKIMNNDK